MARSQDKKFYNGKRWKKIRLLALARDQHLCVICRKHGTLSIGTEVDHIIPYQIKPRMAYDLENLQTLCHQCHTIKTAGDARGGPRFCRMGYPDGIGCKNCTCVV